MPISSAQVLANLEFSIPLDKKVSISLYHRKVVLKIIPFSPQAICFGPIIGLLSEDNLPLFFHLLSGPVEVCLFGHPSFLPCLDHLLVFSAGVSGASTSGRNSRVGLVLTADDGPGPDPRRLCLLYQESICCLYPKP